MPQVALAAASIVSSITSIATTYATIGLTAIGVPGGAAGFAGAAASFTVQAAGQALTAAAMGALTAPKLGAQGSPTAFQIDTDAGIPFPFGRVGVAGHIDYRVAFDATNRYQSLFCTVAGSGPIKSWVSHRFDGEVTTFDGTLNKATNGQHVGFMWLKLLNGTQPQSALTSPTGTGAGIPAPNWGTDHKQSGRAVYCLTMFENSKLTEFQGGVVKPLHIIEGLYGYDPREDDTYPGGSGDCRIDDPSTWVWIDNGAIAALNWAIGRWEGSDGGMSPSYGVPYACSLVGGLGASLDGIDVAALVNAANVADANGWTVAAVPTSKDDPFEVYKGLLQAAGALPSRNAGRISCITRGEEQSSVVTVTAADTAGPVEISLGQSRLERKNTAIARFWSEAHQWEMTPITAVTDAAWLTADGGAKRSIGIDYAYVPNATQAAQLAYYDLADARERRSGTVTFKPHLRRVQPGDTFTFSEPGFLLDGVKVKCLRRAFDPMTGMVKVTWREETDAKHTDAYDQTGETPPDVDPGDPPDVYVEPPIFYGVTDDSGEAAIYFRAPSIVPVGLDYIAFYRSTTTTPPGTQTGSITAVVGETKVYNDTPGPGAWYYWIASVDLDGNSSALIGPASVTLT